MRSAEGASLHDVAAAYGHVPLSIARSFGTGVVDLARNTVIDECVVIVVAVVAVVQ